MKRQIVLVICLILLTGTILAVPSIPHAFRGSAKYTNGQNIPDGYVVTARLDNQPISTSSVIKDGKYGYDDPLLVSDIIGNGEKVYFYINGKSVENEPVNFIIGDVTNLDLIVKSPPSDFDGCGDGTCDDGETCSNCPVDCGSCSYDDNGGSPSGGTSTTSTSSSTTTTTSTSSTNGGDEIIDMSSDETQQTTGRGITGAVIGFVKSGTGIGLIFAIFVLIIGIGIVTLRKKSPKEEKISSEE